MIDLKSYRAGVAKKPSASQISAAGMFSPGGEKTGEGGLRTELLEFWCFSGVWRLAFDYSQCPPRANQGCPGTNFFLYALPAWLVAPPPEGNGWQTISRNSHPEAPAIYRCLQPFTAFYSTPPGGIFFRAKIQNPDFASVFQFNQL
jgi:hypothetical protein